MSVRVACPSCGKELKAPAELAGKRVTCPRCSGSFRLPGSTGNTQRIALTNRGGLILDGEETVATHTSGEEAQAQAAPAPALEQGPPSSPPADPPSPAKVPQRQKPAVPRKVRTTPPRITRAGRAAKFVAADAAETRVQLGADGKLPDLVLRQDQQKKKEDDQQAAQKSNPLLLIGVLCFSVTASVILLFVDPSAQISDTRSQTEAREMIQAHYIGTSAPFEPYQEKLRQAIRAYNQKDDDTELGLYREVVDMIHDESNSKFGGLTGSLTGNAPPSDRHLEGLLATLLNEQ